MNLQVRGASGSGKSELVRRLLCDHGGSPVETTEWPHPDPERDETKKITLYRCAGDLYVLGEYNCDPDRAPGKDNVLSTWPRLQQILGHYLREDLEHVIFESRLASDMKPHGDYLDFLHRFDIWWATLGTSLETCKEHMNNRNGGKGFKDTKAEKRFDATYRRIHRYADDAQKAKVDCCILPYDPDFQSAYGYLHALLELQRWNCGGEHDPPLQYPYWFRS